MTRRFLPTSATLGLFVCIAVSSTTADAAKKKPAGTDAAVPDFDKSAAVTAIAEAPIQKCKATNAQRGEGHVTITFGNTGEASNVTIDKGPWIGSPVAKCMVKQFKTAKVPAFKGDVVTVGKTFKFGE